MQNRVVNKMEALTVGEGALELNKLSKEIEKSKSFVALVREWKQFAQYLGVNDVKILDVERKLTHGDVELGGVPREILKYWKAEKGTEATVAILYDALVHCNVRDIADMIVAEFTSHEQILSMVKFEIYGKNITLCDLLRENVKHVTSSKIVNQYQKCFTAKPLQLIKEELAPPTKPKYYIQRTLSYVPTEIDSKILLSERTKDHIFLFKGTRKAEVAQLTGYKPIDRSGNQLEHVNVQYILLECDDDFDDIVKVTTKPVHLIERDGDRYIWLKSKGGLNVIEKFIQTGREIITEENLTTKILSLTPPCVMSIADSPGMGKTILMANLAANIHKGCPSNSIHLFIVLQEFSQYLAVVNSSATALEKIAAYSAPNDTIQPILLEVLKQTRQLYLYLDGYDEVSQSKLESLNAFLKHAKQLKNVKLIVTTRPHVKTNLENIFNQLAYEIHPFDLSNQTHFLFTYWITEHGCCECRVLKQFGRNVLKALKTNMTDMEKEIAGIPLQCMMLAEVYAKHAVRTCKLKTIPDISVAERFSFFDMYKKLVDLKFKKIEDVCSKENYVNAHVYYAIQLLFPPWSDTFFPILKQQSDVDGSNLYSIGLIEHSPGNLPRFIHRSFAEYFLAEFIVQNIDQQRACADILFGEIMGKMGITIRKEGEWKWNAITYFELKNPVIVYFIEMHMKEYVNHKLLHCLSLGMPFKANMIDMCVALGACCSHNLEHTFYFIMKRSIIEEFGYELRDRYIKHLPHVVIEDTKNLTLLHKVLEFTKSKFNVDLNFHELPYWDVNIPVRNVTPLHVAVSKGKYNMVIWLVEQYKKLDTQWGRLECLLHVCVRSSVEDSDSVLEDKLLIIDILMGIHPGWIDQRNDDDLPPILQPNVHLHLLQRLVQHGANINAYSKDYGTILHQSAEKSSYSELVRWAFSNGFTLVNNGARFHNRTPLMYAILKFRTVDDEVLSLFTKIAMDWNAQDFDGNLVIFYALRFSEDAEFIRKVLEYGADVNHKDKKGRNAAHIVMLNSGLKSNERLTVLRMLVLKGFIGLDAKDINRYTPHQLAQKERIMDNELLAFFKEHISNDEYLYYKLVN